MELLLNLAWLLLALPAYWLWREYSSAPARRRFSSLQCVLALACTIVVLFPVISATDDLRAMRAEAEESPSSKRSVGQRSSDKPSISRFQSQPAAPVVAGAIFSRTEIGIALPTLPIAIATVTAASATGRDPPATSLA